MNNYNNAKELEDNTLTFKGFLDNEVNSNKEGDEEDNKKGDKKNNKKGNKKDNKKGDKKGNKDSNKNNNNNEVSDKEEENK